MGSGASAENARATVSSMLANKPEDASDIKVHLLFPLFFVTFHLNMIKNDVLLGLGASQGRDS